MKKVHSSNFFGSGASVTTVVVTVFFVAIINCLSYRCNLTKYFDRRFHLCVFQEFLTPSLYDIQLVVSENANKTTPFSRCSLVNYLQTQTIVRIRFSSYLAMRVLNLAIQERSFLHFQNCCLEYVVFSYR